MVKYHPSLDRVFSALADPTRRAILSRLMEGRQTVGKLAEPFEITPSGFSKHLRVLERAGLLQQQKRGRERICEVRVEPLQEAMTWLETHRRMWNASLDSFAAYAENRQAKRNRRKR